MASYKYQSEIDNLYQEIILFHEKRKSAIQQISDKVGDYHALTEEDELLHQELAFYISQATEEGIEPSEAEELKNILREAENSHKNIGIEITTIISSI